MPGKKPVRSTVIPGMRYRNAKAAIKWLCEVFGFREHHVVRGRGNMVHHAELTLGGGMIMLGSFRDDDQHRYMKQPDELGGAETRGINLTVPDVRAVYDRALAAGAGILRPLEARPFGQSFACRDLEGRLWHVSDYDPWNTK